MKSNYSSYQSHIPVNKKAKRDSAIITSVISVLILLLVITYKSTFTTVTPPSYIGLDFGTDEVGMGKEEPIDGELMQGDGGTIENPNEESSAAAENNPEKSSDNFLTDESSDESSGLIAKKEKESAASKATKTTKNKVQNSTHKNSATSNTNNNSNSSSKNNKKAGIGEGKSGGNPQGNAALGNIIKGKGSNPNSKGQGNGNRPGNEGDPAGGVGSGGTIGGDRKLISVIPGTMGRGGKKPEHDCSAKGTVYFKYTVDRNGNITSANRSAGVSNTCLVNTGISWIKKYVKADKGTSSASGTYEIKF